jgi:hypothetical protein
VAAIDEGALKTKYSTPWNPCEIALSFCMERLLAGLKQDDQAGRLVYVVFESRENNEDEAREFAFRRIADNQSNWGYRRLDFPYARFGLVLARRRGSRKHKGPEQARTPSADRNNPEPCHNLWGREGRLPSKVGEACVLVLPSQQSGEVMTPDFEAELRTTVANPRVRTACQELLIMALLPTLPHHQKEAIRERLDLMGGQRGSAIPADKSG